MKVQGANSKIESAQLPDPPYNAKTGESLGPKKPGNYGRPLIIKEENTGDEQSGLTISERLGIKDNPFDEIMITTSKPPPQKQPLKIGKTRKKKLKKKK